MASQFLPTVAHSGPSGGVEPRVVEATMLSTDTAQVGEFVFFDTADNTVKVTGADPALILGLMLGHSPLSTIGLLAKPQPYATNKQPVAVIHADTVVALSSTTTPAASFLYRKFGLTKVSAGGRNFWQCDTAKTAGTARGVIVDINIAQGIFYCKFLPANLQGQTVVS